MPSKSFLVMMTWVKSFEIDITVEVIVANMPNSCTFATLPYFALQLCLLSSIIGLL